jgi:hypothetical protein
VINDTDVFSTGCMCFSLKKLPYLWDDFMSPKAQIKLPTVASPWRIVHVIKSWQHLLPTVQAIKGRMNHSFFLEEKSSLWFSILSNPAAFISNLQPHLRRREFSCHWNINIYYSQNTQTELAIKCMDFIQTFSLNLKIHTQIYHL